MTATHCLDGKKRRNGTWVFSDDWARNNFVLVGIHEINKSYPNNDDPHARKIFRDTAWTLLIPNVRPLLNKTIIEFPIFCNKMPPCKFEAKLMSRYILFDVAVMKLQTEIMFVPGHVERAMLDSPSLNCQTCVDDCSSNIAFKAIGWGWVAKGND